MKATEWDGKRLPVGTGALTWVLRACGALLLGGSALGQSLVNGGYVNGALSAPGERHTYTFDTLSRDRFTLRLVDVTGSGFTPRIEVINPHGELIQSDESPDVAMIETTRVMGGATFASGTYTVVVSHASNATFQPGDYELHFVKFPEAGVQLLDGLTVFDELRPGELRVFTFELEPGQVIKGRIEVFQGSTLHLLKEDYGPNGGYGVSTGGSVITFIIGSSIPGGTNYILLSDSRGTGTGSFSIVVEGLSAAPPEPPNIFHPPYHALDPKLRDIGGHPGLGPRIGDRREPFNVAIDCTFMESPSFYSISMWATWPSRSRGSKALPDALLLAFQLPSELASLLRDHPICRGHCESSTSGSFTPGC